jgi:hypothetical protein
MNVKIEELIQKKKVIQNEIDRLEKEKLDRQTAEKETVEKAKPLIEICADGHKGRQCKQCDFGKTFHCYRYNPTTELLQKMYNKAFGVDLYLKNSDEDYKNTK